MGDATHIIKAALEGVRLGPPLSDREGRLPHVTVYPIFPARIQEGLPPVLTLSDGRDGGALIEEVSCEDAVRITNPLSVSLYGGESECIVGQTQNRALKHNVLIPPHTSRYALVNCVERGQPTRHGKGFAVDAVCPWSIRFDKLRQLAQDGRIDQGRVWEQVEAFLRRAKVSSPTLDLCAAFQKRGQEIARALNAFPCLPGQVGLMSAVGPNLYLDLFSEPEMLERRFHGILASALVEGLIGFSDVRVPMDVAQRALEDLLKDAPHSRSLRPHFSPRGDGDLLTWGREATVAAFVSGGEWRHLAAHRAPGRLVTGGREHARDLSEARERYFSENREWLWAMQEAYAPRRRSYGDLVAGFSASAATWRMQARALRQTAGPLPGHLIGLEEADPEPDAVPLLEPGLIASAVADRASRVSAHFSADLLRVETLLDRLKIL
ncbi:MAG: hypothetical protein A3F84_03970 [Candidatus Handelsmanbacteria bacterium RIFCSPLOWO2_12_FULL_64_10]|uniref:ARG and Rhodanese-Phosphatase-superfamily-associated domain-containing protein n=1 Tax=Handelsmanbacteria sp. (strain RIFCSPLOWO2_12_FULL_64_10) TaxID=1817868 RepID=A0A1F6CA85_HANXR|nr:MAG: hypothetical protein A3F84_03970 [Candidatus Handelsmanbacteria bacterium RIFCSPLOWO2_12_FULL_64_10]